MFEMTNIQILIAKHHVAYWDQLLVIVDLL